MNLFFKLALLLFCVSQVSCTSYFVRKDCEKLNWYQVGFDAAMRGERIANDAKINQCRKAEADISESQLDLGFKAGMGRYCDFEQVYQIGKLGDNFNTEFCDPGQLSRLKQRHHEGIVVYCQNGTVAGLSGKKYQQVCPENLEKSFLPDYRKARKKYLQGVLVNDQEKLTSVDNELKLLQSEKWMVDGHLSSLPVVPPADNDPYLSHRQQLRDQSWQLSSRINEKSAVKNHLQQSIDQNKQEIVTLD
jgi:hypothetical protein